MTTPSSPSSPAQEAVSPADKPVEHEVRGFYTDELSKLYPTQSTMFLNFGYWSAECDSLDEACRALADLLADAAGITEGDRVLDSGFGYADQDLHWLRTRHPALIAGLNVTTTQVEIARQRGREAGLEDRLDLRVGSATDMPFDADTFDRVVALESAFHFDTREDFFREAARVLRPGGVLAAADMILLPGNRENRIKQLGYAKGLVPEDNWYDARDYARRLGDAGFVNVRIRPITDHVYTPMLDYMKKHMRKDGKEVLAGATLMWGKLAMANTDYVLVSAEKAAA
jgi:erythromycin 3''-O-methyltransferase